MRSTPDADDAALTSITPIALEDVEGGGFRPASQAITSAVRDAIIDGRLAPGMRIRQEPLARHLGVSRIPVREALRLLESEGLVTLVPHSGARVARMDFGELVELYRIREALEPLAIAESAKHLTDDQLAELRTLAAAIEDAAHDPSLWPEADRTFHLATCAAAGLPRLLTMVEGFWNTTQQYRRAHFFAMDDAQMQLVHYEHRLILDALERRDPVDAELRHRSHVRRTRIGLVKHAELFPDDL